jgi:hypothetical protein
LAQSIAHEVARGNDGKELIHHTSEDKAHKVTYAEAILRKWATSSNPTLQKAFIEIAFGKVPDVKRFEGAEGDDIRIELVWKKYNDDTDS